MTEPKPELQAKALFSRRLVHELNIYFTLNFILKNMPILMHDVIILTPNEAIGARPPPLAMATLLVSFSVRSVTYSREAYNDHLRRLNVSNELINRIEPLPIKHAVSSGIS